MDSLDETRQSIQNEEVTDATQRINVNSTGANRPTPPRRPSDAAQRRRAAAAKKKKERIVIITLIAVAAILLISVIVGVSLMLFRQPEDDGLIYKKVFAAGIDLGGMTQEQAKEALHKATDDTYRHLNMTVQVLDKQLTLAPKDTGISLDVDAVVEAAYNYGRTGTYTQGSSYTVNLIPHLSLDTAYIQSALNSFVKQNKFDTTLKQTNVSVLGDRPNLSNSEINTSVVHQTLTITMGTAEYDLNIDNLYQQILDAYNINVFDVVASCTEHAPDAIDWEAVFELYCSEPVNAYFDTETYAITPEKYGYGIAKAELLSAVESATYGDVITFELRYIEPEITSDFYSGEMFQDVLASFTTVAEGSEAWNVNLKLVCDLLNGKIIKSGDEFSLNELIGEPTTRAGYRPVNMYIGKSFREVVGGGISQVASTLYTCTLLADLEILERHSHSYVTSYIDAGFDAEVYYGLLDFRFRNNTEQPIRIDVTVNGGTVTINIIGTDTRDYTVEVSTVIDKTKTPSTIYNTMSPNNPNGYVVGDVLVQAVPGYDISTYMYRYSKTDGTLLSETLIVTSVYSKLDEVVVRIEDPNAPQDPTDPTDPTEVTDPTESTEATDPTEDTQSTEPSDSADPTDATEDTQSTEPTESTETTEPTEPTETTDPIEPTDPVEPEEEPTE